MSGGADFQRLYRRLALAELALEDDGATRPAAALEARVRAIAGEGRQPLAPGLDVLVFRCGGQRLSLPVAALHQVLEARGLCALPGMPRHVLGATVSGGRIVPVLDLRVLLHLEGGVSDLTRLLVVRGEGPAFALAVEALELQLRVDPRALAPPPPGPWLYTLEDGVRVLNVAALEPGPER